MAALDETTLSNVVVRVSTPPPLPKAPTIGQETLEPTFYAYSKTYPVLDDSVTHLLGYISRQQHIRETLLKAHQERDPNPPTTPNPPPPPGVFGEPPKYYTTHMPGIRMSAEDLKTPGYINIPCGVLIKPTSSIISMPYFPKDPERVRNGVLNNAKTANPAKTTYLWESHNPIVDQRTQTSVDALQPRPDGAVEMTPQPRERNSPYESISLDPFVFEDPTGLKNGKELNSFSLILSVVPGCSDMSSNPPPWRITISFGEVTIHLDEGSSTLEVTLGNGEPVKITIAPGSAVRSTHHFGERPYILTFIPVFNGLLISDGPPGDSNWPEKVSYVQKDPGKSILTELNSLLWPEPTRAEAYKIPMKLPTLNNGAPLSRRVPAIAISNSKSTKVDTGDKLKITYHRCGGMLKFVPIYFPEGLRAHTLNRGAITPITTDINDLPLPTALPQSSPGGPQFTSVDSFDALEGIYTSFAVTTSEASRFSATGLPPGLDIDSDGLITGLPSRSGDWQAVVKAVFNGDRTYTRLFIHVTDIPVISTEDVFELPSSKNATILPILYYPLTSDLTLRAKQAVLPTGDNTPFNDVVIEYKREEPDQRLPVETWGYITYKREENYTQFKNEDGFLTVNDVPEPRIRSFSVDRSFDGSSGSITWDRYDPVTGLHTRPVQNAGAIRISMEGGENTIPGTVFTGLAIGNAGNNQESSNEIQVPLYGRETKLTEEGGLRLVNVPFFDGWEHSLVMEFLCNYGGVPLKNLSSPYRLPSSFNIQEAVIDFTTGTPVMNAMSEVARLAGTLFFFDRFGDLVYRDVSQTSGVNWNYPDTEVIDYNDSPDFSTMRNNIVLSAMIAHGSYSTLQIEEKVHSQEMMSPILMTVRITTTPDFQWDKMMFYAVNGVLPNQAEFNRIALQIAKGVSRPRATGKVTIPGNAEIDLLDTFNENWVVTQLSQNVDTQAKSWNTTLSLELILDPGVIGTATILPVGNIE